MKRPHGRGPHPDDKKRRLQLSDVTREARDLVWTHRRRLALGAVLMILNRAAGLVLPFLSKYVIDDVINKARADLLTPFALVLAAATVVQAITSFAMSQILGVAAQRAITDMRKSVQAHVEQLPVRFFDSTKSGILISRIMSDAEGIRNLVGNGLVRLVGGFITGVVGLVFLFTLNWKLTVIMLLVLGTFGGAMAVAFRKLRPIFRERSRINAEVTGRLAESLGGIRVVKAYVAERAERVVFAKGVHRLFRNVAATITGVSAITAFTTVIVGAISVIVILIGGRAILANTMTLGELVQYVFFAGLVAMPLVSIAEIGTQISEAFAGLDRIRELQRMNTEQDDDRNRQPLPDVRGDITFEDVVFSYVPETPVLKRVSLHAPAGSTTALVGSSGSGKSTLISLVMGFNAPETGRVFVDGVDLATLRLHDYRGHLGVVLQDNFLFDGTIAENISFSKPHATRAEVEEVARIAHAHEFISDFEDGYDTIVGERGVKLSGGQRQRIAIARAILANPRILILDEATSSLDSESEGLIQEGLRALRRGRTTFVIAHRLSTIRSADQILVLEHGEIVERGRHHQLMALGGRYKELHDRQHRIEEDIFVNPGEDPSRVLDEESVAVSPGRAVGPRDL
ncbi:MAG: ABC transporter ATP-binding protein/permease [Gemmatimonadota bacterium]|nr:ABC transporter ATP-binding protein/permease [Gemmatimonadota bacterium]MDH5196662.1 ABC transporter ATP-binding protein/permease [Gemmatimonadota bacterium]